MKSILKKAGELGSAIADSVKDVADDIKDAADDLKSETAFLVEEFGTIENMQERLNALESSLKTVDVEDVCYNSNKEIYVAVIKIVD